MVVYTGLFRPVEFDNQVRSSTGFADLKIDPQLVSPGWTRVPSSHVTGLYRGCSVKVQRFDLGCSSERRVSFDVDIVERRVRILSPLVLRSCMTTPLKVSKSTPLGMGCGLVCEVRDRTLILPTCRCDGPEVFTN